jgi:Pyruvate/2-oxoacid:ferredoxin oxidoreductase gamma subunit
MNPKALVRDPFSVIVTGVGGQGNVLASRLLGDMLAAKGYFVTIGETFGASQRGGSVMSHIRVSRESAWSPQIPRGKADVIVSLEPVEAVRVLWVYGNPGVVFCRTPAPSTRRRDPRGAGLPVPRRAPEAVARILRGPGSSTGRNRPSPGNAILTNFVMLGP